MTEYYLFGTSGCHLCEQAEAIINNLPGAVIFEKKDIIEDSAWSEKYAIRIPVFYHLKSKEELGWPFDETGLSQFISDHS